MSRRIGLVAVGVDNVGADLPVLKGAASGAQHVADWLESQKAFGVECICKLLVDGSEAKVTTHDVLDATRELVDGGGLDLLILYFSSHGIVQSANSELVLLSGAGNYPNEAIDIAATFHNSRYVNIPHVLIISDACRNAVDPFSKLGRLRGVAAVEPLSVAGRKPGKVDIFYATEPSQTAKEYKGDGFFTKILLETLHQPPIKVCEHWTNYPNPVIPTWQLEDYLFEEVPMRAGDTQAAFEQTPDFSVTSREPLFLAFAKLNNSELKTPDDTEQKSPEPDGKPQAFQEILQDDGQNKFIKKSLDETAGFKKFETMGTSSVARDNKLALKKAASGFLQSPFTIVDKPILVRAGLWDAYNLAQYISNQENRTLRSGLRVYGCSTVQVLTPQHAKRSAYHGNPINISTFGFNKPSSWHNSITLILDGKSITVLPFYPGYIGHIHVNDGVVQHVSFTPGLELRGLLGLSEQKMHELQSAQSVAAAFARAGKLSSLVDEDALTLAKHLRKNKRIDPILGVYAAYAYTLAGQQEGVDSIYEYFQLYRDISPRNYGPLPIPFDVALLAGELNYSQMAKMVAPFVPMMNLGWSMLSDLASSEQLDKLHLLRELRLNAEWTTFALESKDILLSFFNKQGYNR